MLPHTTISAITIIVVALYIYSALALSTIARKTQTRNPWLAWIPIADYVLTARIAKKHWWPVLALPVGVASYIILTVTYCVGVTPPMAVTPFEVMYCLAKLGDCFLPNRGPVTINDTITNGAKWVYFAAMFVLYICYWRWMVRICEERDRSEWWAKGPLLLAFGLVSTVCPYPSGNLVALASPIGVLWNLVALGILAWRNARPEPPKSDSPRTNSSP
jgi:hypothetical protein